MAVPALSCLARNGRRPGEESGGTAIADQTIEAQLVFGQIKPERGSVVAGTNGCGEDMATPIDQDSAW
jgi:hypothetical protein